MHQIDPNEIARVFKPGDRVRHVARNPEQTPGTVTGQNPYHSGAEFLMVHFDDLQEPIPAIASNLRLEATGGVKERAGWVPVKGDRVRHKYHQSADGVMVGTEANELAEGGIFYMVLFDDEKSPLASWLSNLSPAPTSPQPDQQVAGKAVEADRYKNPPNALGLTDVEIAAGMLTHDKYSGARDRLIAALAAEQRAREQPSALRPHPHPGRNFALSKREDE